MNEWHKLARKKFPYGQISGDGRWACVRKCHQSLGKRWKISLHENQDRAERASAKECGFGCLGCWNHFVTPVGPAVETPALVPVKAVAPAPPLIGLMKI